MDLANNQEGREMSKASSLLSPVKLGAVSLKNRVVMAPLTRNRAGEGNVPQDLNVEYYQQRASAGLIITEATQISPEGVGYPATPGIHSSEQIEGWRKVTQAVHSKGGKIFLQLWFCGRISHPSMLPDNQTPVSASAIKPSGEAITYEGMQEFVEPRALEVDEIKAIVDQYRVAANNAKAAGFDGVEVHAANGYLLDQFLRDGSNKRTDNYGGSVENRSRFLMEVLEAVYEAWEPDHVGVRLSPENGFNDMKDSDPQNTFNEVAERLSSQGLAYLHVLEGDMLGEVKMVDYGQIKNCFNGNYMANCGYTQERAERAVANNDADVVAFGALYIANPDLVERFSTGADLNTPDQATFYGGDGHGYTDYEFMAKEEAIA